MTGLGIVKLFWWRSRSLEGNFGDELSAPVIEKHTSRTVEWAPLSDCSHLGIGSTLQFPWTRRTITRNPNITVLGSGLMAPELISPVVERVNFVAVRGWLTRSVLESQGHRVGRNVGDLGILASTLISDNHSKTYNFGIIPHHSHFERFIPMFAESTNIKLIDVRSNNCIGVLNEIAKCKIIISESLHGLIAADSLSIPNIWLRVAPLHKGDDFKFIDYFSTIGRNPNDFIRPQQINDKHALGNAIHKHWKPVNQLKAQVMEWLSDHFSNQRRQAANSRDGSTRSDE